MSAFSLLSEHLCGGDVSLSSISGLTYFDGETIISNPPKDKIPLSDLPFPYEDFEGTENKIVYYEASRGCPFSCKYCLSSAQTGMRIAPIEKVKKELQIFLDRNIKQVKFVDRTFNCNDDFATEIVNYLIQNDNGTTNFHFEVAAELLNSEFMSHLATARKGLFQLEIGVQSTNQDTLRAISRKSTFEYLTECVKTLQAPENIHIHLDLIAGLPCEDFASFKKSFNDVHALLPNQLQLGFLKILKGSGMEVMCDEHGISYSPFPPYEVLKTNLLSYDGFCF